MHSQTPPSNGKIKSAARLAAEEAFSGLSTAKATPSSSAAPIVRLANRRLRLPPAASRVPDAMAAQQPDRAAAPQGPVENSKSARVFLVRTEVGGAEGPKVPTAEPAQDGNEGGATSYHPPVRRRRVRNLSGPARVIYSAQPADTGEVDRAAGVGAEDERRAFPTAPTAVDLWNALSALEPIFAAIRTAAAFEVVDGGTAADWSAIGRAADRIGDQLDGLLATLP